MLDKYYLIYLFMGVVLLASLYIPHYLDNKRNDNSISKIEYSIAQNSSKEKAVEALGVIMAIIVVVFLWPIVLVWLIKTKWDDKNVKKIEPDKPFKVEKGDLIRELTADEIELTEMVNDPMNAVPELPFGHLHSVWLRFKDKITSKDKLYSFSALYKKWHGNIEYTGYVIVKNNKPDEFLILDKHRYLENEEQN